MSKLCYPTVDLFLYDLKSPLNAQKIEIEENRQRFQSRIKDQLTDEYKFIEADEENSDLGYQPLLKPNFLKLETDEFEGYFYPVFLNDTYGLLVNCSLKSNLEPQPIDSSFKSLKEELSQYSQLNERLTIGKTQIISGWLSEEATDVEKIAEDCYQSVVDNSGKWSSNLYGKGKFLNSHIFEIWNPLSNYLDDHLLIILYFQNLVAIIGGETAIVSLFDFEGKKCQTIANNWPFYQNKDNTPPTEQKQELEVIYPCNNYIFGGILTPLLLFSLVCLICIFVLNFKGIIQKFKL